MTPTAIIALVMQILALAPTLVQAAAAVKQLGEMVANGNEPTQAEIDALLATLSNNSETIAGIAEADSKQAGPGTGTGDST